MNKNQGKKYIAEIMAFIAIMLVSCNDSNEMFQQEESSSLVLQFSLTPSIETRSGSDNTKNVFYTISDGMVRLDSVSQLPMTRAITPGDGVVADGGGMKDLSVFLVDNDNDNIVRRKSFTVDPSDTQKIVTFTDLEMGEYTVYAYANSVGNDWFILPSEGESSFAGYKDAVLKTLDGTQKIAIGNERMPLTGKKEIRLYGDVSETIEMLRPVVQLSITLKNERTKGVNLSDFSLDKIYPTSGYVFSHSNILPKDITINYGGTSGNNTYHLLPGIEKNIPLLPNIEREIYRTLLYENYADIYSIFLTYKQNIEVSDGIDPGEKKLQDKNIKTLIKLKDQDLYLRVTDNYQLEMVSSVQIDDRCYWLIGSAGKQERSFITNNTSAEIKTLDISNSGEYFFVDGANTKQTLRYGNTSSYYFSIGNKGNYWLKNTQENTISVVSGESNASLFEYVAYHLGASGQESEFNGNIQVQIENGSSKVNLTEMLRNQKINLHMTFK